MGCRGIDWVIGKGTGLGLIGPTDPGKSTLLRVIVKIRRLLARASTRLETSSAYSPVTNRHPEPWATLEAPCQARRPQLLRPECQSGCPSASRIAGSGRVAEEPFDFHAGMPRTATTALQTLLATNYSALRQIRLRLSRQLERHLFLSPPPANTRRPFPADQLRSSGNGLLEDWSGNRTLQMSSSHRKQLSMASGSP